MLPSYFMIYGGYFFTLANSLEEKSWLNHIHSYPSCQDYVVSEHIVDILNCGSYLMQSIATIHPTRR